MAKQRITEDMKDRAVALYDRIRNTQKVAKALGISQRSVQRALADRGVDTPAGKQPKNEEPHLQQEMDLPPPTTELKNYQLTVDQVAILQFCADHQISKDSLEITARRPELNLSTITGALAKLTPEQVGLLIHNVSLTRINNLMQQDQQAAQEQAEAVLGKE